MTTSAHQISVVPFKAGLENLDAILDKAKSGDETRALLVGLCGPELSKKFSPLSARRSKVSGVTKGSAGEPPALRRL